jgi:integrase
MTCARERRDVGWPNPLSVAATRSQRLTTTTLVRACRCCGRAARKSAHWAVALALGLRQSEALALQWKDIDLLNGRLTGRRTTHRHDVPVFTGFRAFPCRRVTRHCLRMLSDK